MSDEIRQMIEQHHPYYEVSPYYVVIEEGHGLSSSNTRRIQAGSDVDIYGTEKNDGWEPPSDYALACATLKQIVETVSHQVGACCGVEVTPLFGTLVLNARNGFQPERIVRVRVRHWRGLIEPAGPAEENALKEIEKRLQDLGIRSGQPGA